MLKFILSFVLLVSAASVKAETISIPANPNKMFFITGYVGTTPVKFLIDTGASTSLIPKALLRHGDYYGDCETRYVTTPTGAANVCRHSLSLLSIGNVLVRDSKVVITDTSAPYALLGMNILSLFRIEIDNGILRLVQK